jgi:hypothetical protein
MAMSMSGPGGSRLDPGLALLVAVVLFTSAIFTLASPNKGASHFGSHAPASLVASFAGVSSSDGPLDSDSQPSPVDHVEGIVATPWLVDLSHVTMCVAMGFMLLLMT